MVPMVCGDVSSGGGGSGCAVAIVVVSFLSALVRLPLAGFILNETPGGLKAARRGYCGRLSLRARDISLID